VKREVNVNGSPARLRVEGHTFEYERARSHGVTGTEPGCPLGPSASGLFIITPTDPGSYLVRIGPRSHRVSLGPPGEVSVDGRILRMEVFDPRDLRAGAHSRTQQGRRQITAPMPGKVVRVLVAEGEAVESGQGLVVVEAMKMQNEMKSPQAGVVAEIRTQADATVAAGDILIVIE